MAKNDFKPFATGKGANVTSQPDWEALPALLSGFTAGKASSAQVNKALRQASFIAAALAQYTASRSEQDVLDDGDLSGFIAKMSAAFGKDFQTLDATLTALAGLATGADKLPYFTGNDTAGQTDLTSVGRDIIGKGSIADILTYLGLAETLNPTKRVSIGSVGTGAFDGSTPSINIGDSDSGFIGSADGVLDVYCNNAKVGYIDLDGLHMLAGIATNGNVVLQNDAREHIIIQNADGTPRMFIYKDKGGDGVHLNNGNDASTEYLFHKDGSFYAPFAIRAGGSKKLAVQANDNSTLSAMFNLWGSANRPTVIELDDDQGWHLYSQRNTDGSILFTVNGDIMANRKLNVGDATFSSDGNVNGSVWGGWLNDWLNNNLSRKNTASLGDYGWVRDESTGFIMQWGTLGSSNGTYNFPREFPASCFAVFVTNNNQQGGAVDNAFGYPVSKSQFFAATKASTDGNVVNGYPVAWFAIGR